MPKSRLRILVFWPGRLLCWQSIDPSQVVCRRARRLRYKATTIAVLTFCAPDLVEGNVNLQLFETRHLSDLLAANTGVT